MKVRLRFKLMLVASLLLSLALVFRGGHTAKSTPSLVLSPPDQAKVLVKDNQVTVITPKSTVTRYVPSEATVEIMKNGTVIPHVQEFGFERKPYLGLSMGDQLRIQLGIHYFYAYKLELGFGIGFATQNDTSAFNLVRANFNASYIVYSNTSIFAGVDHTGMLLGGLQVKF